METVGINFPQMTPRVVGVNLGWLIHFCFHQVEYHMSQNGILYFQLLLFFPNGKR